MCKDSAAWGGAVGESPSHLDGSICMVDQRGAAAGDHDALPLPRPSSYPAESRCVTQ